MARKLDGKKVAILVADGFEQVEMTKPREALDEAGAETKIVSLKSGKIQGMNHADKGDKFDVDFTLDEARPEEFDALMIPGGLMNPDALRSNEDALEFTRHFFREGKPVAAICHGPRGPHRRRRCARQNADFLAGNQNGCEERRRELGQRRSRSRQWLGDQS
jgi:protease I